MAIDEFVRFASLSNFVMGEGGPPAAETWKIPPAPVGSKTITPAWLHDPPRGLSASHSVKAFLRQPSIFLSFPSAKKATVLLSGDQNGNIAPSVPESI